MCHRRQAFTLIELLVVIAIIAILAAILFPVFAQAKVAAKKTAALSNHKQLALGVIMYSGDVDDLFPQGEPNVFGYWNLGYTGWQWPCGNGEVDCIEWGNAVLPYIKNQGIFASPGAQNSNPYGYGSSTPGDTFTFNGDLQFSSSSTVVYPSGNVMMWSGILNNNMLGRTWANPNLECNDSQTGACIYVPNTTNGDTGNGSQDTVRGEPGEPNTSKWQFGQGDNFSYVDGHAKFHLLNGSQKFDPWMKTGPNGEVVDYSFWVDSHGNHTCLFGLDDPCGVQSNGG